MNARALREIADLVDQGTPADYIGVGDEVTILAELPSAIRWMETCPQGVLPESRVPVDVRVVGVLVNLDEVPC